jgi:hypothetical protein
MRHPFKFDRVWWLQPLWPTDGFPRFSSSARVPDRPLGARSCSGYFIEALTGKIELQPPNHFCGKVGHLLKKVLFDFVEVRLSFFLVCFDQPGFRGQRPGQFTAQEIAVTCFNVERDGSLLFPHFTYQYGLPFFR